MIDGGVRRGYNDKTYMHYKYWHRITTPNSVVKKPDTDQNGSGVRRGHPHNNDM